MTHADDLQAVSVDEALIEVTSTVAQIRVIHDDGDDDDTDPAKALAEMIRAHVKEATGCEGAFRSVSTLNMADGI